MAKLCQKFFPDEFRAAQDGLPRLRDNIDTDDAQKENGEETEK
jgi:ferredoxin